MPTLERFYSQRFIEFPRRVKLLDFSRVCLLLKRLLILRNDKKILCSSVKGCTIESEMDSTEYKDAKDSFKLFYKKYSKSFWFFIFKTCGDKSMADDVFQESLFKFIRVAPVKKLNEFQQKAYLYKIAVRLIIDQKKRIQIEQKYYVENVPRERRDNNFFLSIDMERVFKLLKPNERTLLWLAYVEEYSHKEISSITNVKEKSVKVQLFRIRKKFANILRKKGFTGGVAPGKNRNFTQGGIGEEFL